LADFSRSGTAMTNLVSVIMHVDPWTSFCWFADNLAPEPFSPWSDLTGDLV
jgi:hypothetical protein